MAQTTVNAALGNIKRNYSKEDYNPFKMMEYIYDNCLHQGAGHTVLIVGYSDRFVNESLRAWQHVLVDKKLLKDGDPIPTLSATQEFVTHTGTVLQFKFFKDEAQHQMAFYEATKGVTTLALCSEYKSPDFLNVIREAQADSNVYDFSKNNEK